MVSAEERYQYMHLTSQRVRIDPPNKFSGREDFDRWMRRLRNYMTLTDDGNVVEVSEAEVSWLDVG